LLFSEGNAGILALSVCHTVKHNSVTDHNVNPYCPVHGCSAKHPHAEDPLVSQILGEIASPQRFLNRIHLAISQLYGSLKDDHRKSRLIAYLTRFRQVEELYFRSLYVLLLAEPQEVPHFVSGENPNSFTDLYERVNEEILLGRGQLTNKDIKYGGLITPLEVLHDGAHVGFRALHFAKAKRFPTNRDKYLEHVRVYVQHIEQMQRLFAAGRDKQAVKLAIADMHRSIFERPPSL
jgi:hypothetical protein